MAKDAELERLKVEQDRAYQRKQSAHEAQQSAWDRRVATRDAMNQAFEAQQSAYDRQQASWNDLSRLRDSYGPRIEALNDQQESAFQNMKRAFDNASSAHSGRDGAGAASYAAQGHSYKAEAQNATNERRRLVAELRVAKERHEALKPDFNRTKSVFQSAKLVFASAKAEHERLQADFKKAKTDFDEAVRAFQARLAIVKSQNQRRNDDKRVIAERAGVPYQYLGEVWVSKDRSGTTNIYFGGAGKPNGPGHGHYVMESNGTVTYKRDPYDPHGAQNFEENRREAATLSMARMAMNQWAKQQTTPRKTQYEDAEFKVDVKAGYDRRYDTIVTDVLIFDRQNRREHYHLVIDDHGNELFAEWRVNHN